MSAVVKQSLTAAYATSVKYVLDTVEEVRYECTPRMPTLSERQSGLLWLSDFIFVPYFPAFYRPGWLKNYVVGPHNAELFESFLSDIWAGIVVAFTLLPQGLSYGALANVPKVNGLYSAVLPSATYIFFGSSLQLSVGPQAVESLLVGQLVAKYVPTYATDITKATDVAQQTALVVAIYMLALSVFKAGDLIRFISFPVMSGFTSGASLTIGISQLKNAFGFPSLTPQIAQSGYEYNYQVMNWFVHNWYNSSTTKGVTTTYLNPYATKITWGILIPLMFLWWLKTYIIPATAERKKQIWFRVFTFISNLMPFFAILIGGAVAQNIVQNASPTDQYAKGLAVIGNLPAGLDIIKIPSYSYSWTGLFGDALPIALIAYMESYAVARKIAKERNELHILNANQELWGIGTANLLGSIASAFPVSGSLSRSSLNAAAGARTPLSKCTTMTILIITLLSLTDKFYYIPNAALSAIIWSAITNLISLTDIWEAWKYHKPDFFVLLLTLSVTFIWNTSIGLALGIGLSAVIVLIQLYQNRRVVEGVRSTVAGGMVAQSSTVWGESKELEQYRVNTDINYITGFSLRSFLVDEVLRQRSEVISGVVLDLTDSYDVDWTGLIFLKEVVESYHHRGVLLATVGVSEYLQKRFEKFGIPFDTYETLQNSLGEKKKNSFSAAGESLGVKVIPL